MRETFDVRVSAAYDGDVHPVQCERFVLKVRDGQCVIRTRIEACCIKQCRIGEKRRKSRERLLFEYFGVAI